MIRRKNGKKRNDESLINDVCRKRHDKRNDKRNDYKMKNHQTKVLGNLVANANKINDNERLNDDQNKGCRNDLEIKAVGIKAVRIKIVVGNNLGINVAVGNSVAVENNLGIIQKVDVVVGMKTVGNDLGSRVLQNENKDR